MRAFPSSANWSAIPSADFHHPALDWPAWIAARGLPSSAYDAPNCPDLVKEKHDYYLRVAESLAECQLVEFELRFYVANAKDVSAFRRRKTFM